MQTSDFIPDPPSAWPLAVHANAAARERLRLVLDDHDRVDLLDELRATFRGSLLAWAIMDTHVHVVFTGARAPAARRWLDDAIARYARRFERRHPDTVLALRGAAHVTEITTPEQLARALNYVHDNPVKAHASPFRRAVESPWTSARDYAGLTARPACNVIAARRLLGRFNEGWGIPAQVRLADLEPRPSPLASIATIAAASAQAFGILPAEFGRTRLLGAPAVARAVAIRVGVLESYTHAQLAQSLGLSRGRVSQIAADHAADHAARVVRTLIEQTPLRRHLTRPDAFSHGRPTPRAPTNQIG